MKKSVIFLIGILYLEDRRIAILPPKEWAMMLGLVMFKSLKNLIIISV